MKIAMSVFVTTLLVWLQAGPAGAQTPAHLHLVLSSGPMTTYQPNEFRVIKVEGRKVLGKVVLQFDIGPQARVPMPWEKTHELNFTATLSDSGKLEFGVEIPQGRQTLKLRFHGYLFSDGHFAGFYLVNGKEHGAFYTKPRPKPANGTYMKI
jgi:hypothetical protein